MQAKIPSELVNPILERAGCEIIHKTERQIVAIKPIGYGTIHIRFKRHELAFGDSCHWLADIHFERGLRPSRKFDSNEVKQFIEKYVKPVIHRNNESGV